MDHVGGLTEGVHTLLFGDLQGRRRIGVLRDDVRALADQHLRGVGFLARIEPRVDPDHLELEVRVYGLRAEQESVDAHHDLGNGEGRDIAGNPRLRRPRGDLADDIPAFMEARVVGRDVVGPLVAGRVLELHVGKALGDLDRRVHVAEGRGEDQPGTLPRQSLDGALGVRALRHALNVHGLDHVTEFPLEREAALVMGVGPAMIADGSDIDETDLQLVGSGCGARGEGHRQRDRDHSNELLHDDSFRFSKCPCGATCCSANAHRDAQAASLSLYLSGAKGCPMHAGVFTLIKDLFPEMITSTTIVTR